MTDDLEAQARELLCGVDVLERDHIVAGIVSWARRLVAESRAGALREALPYMVHQQLCAVIGGYEYGCTCGRSALAAEAEP